MPTLKSSDAVSLAAVISVVSINLTQKQLTRGKKRGKKIYEQQSNNPYHHLRKFMP